ncbi:MAG: hypothetical protein M3Y27_07645 [Acidobacteriota bacterium]|nr:hypothetical protein [Acidobacteriota bacterium]
MSFLQDRLGAKGEPVHFLSFVFPAAPPFKSGVNPAQDSFQRYARILPSFNQRPIQRGEEKKGGAPRAQEMFFDFGEVIKVVGGPN